MRVLYELKPLAKVLKAISNVSKHYLEATRSIYSILLVKCNKETL